MANNILDTILAEKRREIIAHAAAVPLSSLQETARALPPTKGFVSALRSARNPAVIAEVKRASPSRGVIRADLDPVETAKAFADSGAACLSVLTDEKFFQGKLEYIGAIQSSGVNVPILRKDFTCHPYQVWQTRACGADALLLIVAALSAEELDLLSSETLAAGLDALIEVHTAEELDRALSLYERHFAGNQRGLIGINNRDLKTFVTDLQTSEILIDHGRKVSRTFDSLMIISESGIYSGADVKRLTKAGARGFLIGESLVAKGNPGENLQRLILESRAV